MIVLSQTITKWQNSVDVQKNKLFSPNTEAKGTMNQIITIYIYFFSPLSVLSTLYHTENMQPCNINYFLRNKIIY